EVEEISVGAELAKNLAGASAPDSLWSSIQRDMQQARRPTLLRRLYLATMGWPRAPIAIAAALVIAVGATLAWYFEIRQPLHVTVAAVAPSQFEAAGLRAYQAQSQPDWHWDFATQDAKQLRDWLRLASNLHASLPDQRPMEDAERFQLVGVKLVEAGGAPAAVVWGPGAGRPVT